MKFRLAIIAGLALGLAIYTVTLIKTKYPFIPEPADEMIALKQTDPALLKWRESSRINLNMQEPQGIAIAPSGSLYVAGDRAIQVYDAAGNHTTSWNLPDQARCLAVGSDGAVYAGVRDHVERYQPNGGGRQVWQTPQAGAEITSLSINGNIVWAADAGNRLYWRCDTAGHVTGSFGRKDAKKKAPGLIVPSLHLDLIALPGGRLLAANPGRHTVDSYQPDGMVRSSWGVEGNGIDAFCGCCNPTDIALLPDGNIVTAEKGLPRVKVYNPGGKLESVVAGCEEFPLNPMGIDIAVDSSGRIVVLDPLAKVIRIFVRKQ